MFQHYICLLAVLLAGGPSGQPARAGSGGSAAALVARAIDAVGGPDALKSISTLQIDTIGHDYFIDQSERPEGPYVTRYIQSSEKRDVAGGRSRIIEAPDLAVAPDVTVHGITQKVVTFTLRRGRARNTWTSIGSSASTPVRRRGRRSRRQSPGQVRASCPDPSSELASSLFLGQPGCRAREGPRLPRSSAAAAADPAAD
jgi:hypothetical protein